MSHHEHCRTCGEPIRMMFGEWVHMPTSKFYSKIDHHAEPVSTDAEVRRWT